MMTIAALASGGTALSHAQNLTVSAQTPSAISAELVAPTSYDQYLSLAAPSDVAVCDNYTAIADGNSLFVYDRADGVYREYEHSTPIHKIAFDGSGNLYFLSELYLYKLTPEALKNGEVATPLNGIACKGLFAIDGDLLCYYTNNNALKFYSLSASAEVKEVALTSDLQSESPLAFGKDGLYCVCANEQNGYTVYAINLETYGLTAVTNIGEKLKSLAIANNLLCFVSQSGNFYSYNLTDLSASESAESLTPITSDEGGYVSLCSYNGDLYAVKGKIVRHYSSSKAAFTEYEIGSSSPSVHRLQNASEVLLSENRLFIADDGNDRISVYDTETMTFEKSITSYLPTPYLASYQNTLLVSSASETIVYSLSSRTYGNELLKLEDEDVSGNIVGVASVYGRYYVLTDNNYCYTISKESGEWAWTETHKNTQTLRALAFTADVYGSLYIAYDNDGVYRFTEKELLNAEEGGELIVSNLHSPEKIAVDYNTDLYALTNGSLTRYTKNDEGMYAPSATYTPSYNLVKDDSPRVNSFTFGVDSAFTYLLYEGDYIVKTDEMQIPVVNPIPVGDAAELVFGVGNTDFTVVTIENDGILIEFDPAMLTESTVFPYVAFERTQSAQTALKIGEEGAYSIVAARKERTGAYKTCLVLTSSCTTLERTEYRTDYAEGLEGYLTNDVSLYKFPYLNELLMVDSLPRGMEVKLLGEVVQLDHAYYQIEFKDENGAIKTGFIPKSYVNLFNGSTPVPETVIKGSTETDDDAVWRCAYLILGFGAIAILVDFLILHKPKETEE